MVHLMLGPLTALVLVLPSMLGDTSEGHCRLNIMLVVVVVISCSMIALAVVLPCVIGNQPCAAAITLGLVWLDNGLGVSIVKDCA